MNLSRALLILALGLVGSCAPSVPSCAEATPCPQIGEVCAQGECVAQSCVDSSSCPLGSRCSAGACLPGCELDEDCAPEDHCDEGGVCAARVCLETDRDCPFQHWCDPEVGDCVLAQGPFCAPCTLATVDEDCNDGVPGPVRCWAGRCAVPCVEGAACPSGFACVALDPGDGGDPESRCVAPCELYE